MATPRKEVHAEQRQRILDYLNTHGEQSAKKLSAALQMGRSTLANYLGPMRKDAEIDSREERGATHYVTFYRALVQSTKLRSEPAEAPHPLLSKFKILGREVHYGTHRDHPNPSGGGQGCIHESRGIASCATWI